MKYLNFPINQQINLKSRFQKHFPGTSKTVGIMSALRAWDLPPEEEDLPALLLELDKIK